jgi:heavy metal sensor kinase
MPSRWPDRPWPTSLGGRLTLWNTAVVLAATLASLLAARLAARATLYANADAELRAGAAEVVLALEDLYPNVDAVVAEIRRKARSHEQRGWFSQLLTEDGTTIWKSNHCPDAVADFPPSRLDRVENIVQVGPYRYVRLRIVRPGQPAYHVRVGTYTTGLDEGLTALMRQLTMLGIGLSLLTPLVGWWLARRATRPFAAVLEVAEGLRPTHLGDRLPVRDTGDELDQFARTINRLLDEVAGHVDRQQQFVADAAHELRGPLAAVRSALEVAVSQERPAAEYREALADVLEETRHLAKLANDLLVLAETGSEGCGRPPELVDLATIVRQTCGMFAGAAEDCGIRITVEDRPAVVAADAGQLRQVLGNLLDNAIRFTPPGGTVALRLGTDAEAGLAILSVTDTGAGIAAEHIDRIFDRFYKVDAARARNNHRSGGLGLPICKAIVERHGGSIVVTSQPGRGTTFTVSLPLENGPARPIARVAAAATA